jgi:hypothetical protein
MAKVLEDHCPLCGAYIEVKVSAYAHKPFIDGKCYREICFPCSEAPTRYGCTDDGVAYYLPWDPKQLASVEEMMGDGFDKKEATASIKAVREAIKKNLKS